MNPIFYWLSIIAVIIVVAYMVINVYTIFSLTRGEKQNDVFTGKGAATDSPPLPPEETSIFGNGGSGEVPPLPE